MPQGWPPYKNFFKTFSSVYLKAVGEGGSRAERDLSCSNSLEKPPRAEPGQSQQLKTQFGDLTGGRDPST